MQTYTIDENKIDITDDYDRFKWLKGNRPIDQAWVSKLMKKMRIKDLFTPIMVNEKNEVIDGQHRLEARRRLGLIVPFYVVNNYSLAEVQQLNADQKKWSSADFTESNITLGKKDYETYKWFRTRYKLSHSTALFLLAGGTSDGVKSASVTFTAGNFKVKDLEEAKRKAELLEKIAPHFKDYTHRSFVNAFFYCYTKKAFNFKQFLARLEIKPGALVKCATTDQYIDLIEEIYNYRSKIKVSLRYGD